MKTASLRKPAFSIANGNIVDVAVAAGFTFDPDTVNISVGDTVRWTWAVADTALPADLLARPIHNIARLTT